jgi:hypothetical protein
MIPTPECITGVVFFFANLKHQKSMKSSYLDYYKMILSKVSFDRGLFTKELKKAQQSLSPLEKQKLYHWLELEGMITQISLRSNVET